MRKLTKSEYTPAEARQELANLLQEKIDSYGAQLRKLREREVGRKALAKGELCLLCAQLPVKCECLKLRKTSVEEANREIGGMKSVMRSPTFGGGAPKVTGMPKPAPRVGNPNRAVSGVIPNAKAEPAAKKTKIPRLKKAALKKHTAAMPAADPRPTPTGIPGKQPVGAGGGDAFKVPHPATTASLNDVRQMAPAAANATKDKAALPAAKAPAAAPKPAAVAQPKAGVHPDTQASLAGVRAMSPASNWKGAGLPGLKAKLQNVQAAHAMAPKPAALPAAKAPAATPDWVTNPQTHGSAKTQLAADKRAGGVGFLNSLISRFSRQKPAASMPTPGMEPAGHGGGPVRSQRFHGALPLQRSEKSPAAEDKPKTKKRYDLGKCAMCKKDEHPSMCKMDPGSPDQGLSGVNHNRRMLGVDTSGRRSKGKKRR